MVTEDDIETMRILFGADINELRNQGRWKDAKEMEQIRDKLMEALKDRLIGHCEDIVSKQMVREQMIKYGFHAPDMTVTEFVEDLPSANLQPKTGCWEKITDTDRYSYWYRCSCCGERIPKDRWGNDYYSPYCPECGAQTKAF